MADFTSDFWHWFIVILTLVSILALIPFLYMNREKKPSGPAETMGHVWDDDLEELNNPLPGWWFNLFMITIVFGLIYLLLYPGLGRFAGFLGWTSVGQYQQEREAAAEIFDTLYAEYANESIESLAENSDAMKAGERLYANYCSVCHGSDARGAAGFPNLRDSDWQWGGEPEQILTSILDGRVAAMPALGAALGEEGIQNVSQYVLSLSGRNHDEKMARSGQEKYMQLCIACHGAEGKGNQALGAPNLTDKIWLYGRDEETIAMTLRNGRNGVMPAFREFLGEDKVHLLAAYIYSISD